MKFFTKLLFSLLVLSAFNLNAQTTLISPTGDGGFENGSTFASNGWSVSNSANNPWIVGPLSNGLITGNAAFVSSNGTTPSYNNALASTNYFWRDVTVPSGEGIITLSFNWIANGESSYDLWQVFTAPTSTTPSAGIVYPGSGLTSVPTAITGATCVANSTLQTTVQTTTITLPASLAGTTFRLIFHWKNDGSLGVDPSAQIDNISLTSRGAGKFISIATGNWGTPSTWDANAVPTAIDTVIVSTGHTVTINATGQVAKELTVNGTLTYGTTPASFAVNGNLTVNTGGLFNVFNGTTGKTLTVAGNIVNDGSVNLSVGATTAGNLTLNGTAVQSLSGSGTFVNSMVRNLTFSNTATATPNISFGFNNLRIANNLSMTGARVNLNGNKIYFGDNAAGSTLTAPNGTGFYNGSFSRWWTTAATGTAITAGADPTNTTSRYPIITATNLNRAFYITRSSSTTTGNTAGYLTVAFNNVVGTTTGLSIADGAYTITDRTNDNWSIAAESGYVYASGTHTLVGLYPDGFFLTSDTSARLTNALATVGNYQRGTLTPAPQRIGLSTAQITAEPFYVGVNATNVLFVSLASGDWNNPTTWNKGLVPSCTDVVTIAPGHNVTVNSVANVCKGLTIASGGILTNASGDLTVGCTLNNNSLVNNGTLTVSGGTLNVNGSLQNNAGSTFNQSAGDIVVDGNDAGNAANSVASGIDIVQLSSEKINWTGGVLTIVDPHANSTVSNTIGYRSSIAHVNVPNTHTLRLGDGISTDAGGNATNGFRINTYVNSYQISFGNLELNTLAGTNRLVTTAYTFGVNGDFTINPNSEALFSSVYVAGNIVNNGTFTSTSLLALAKYQNGVASASTTVQDISGAGVFRNSATTSTANLSSLTVNNTNPSVTLNVPLSVSSTLTLTAGIVNTTNANILRLGTATGTGTLSTGSTTVSGGKSTAYINGPFARTIANTNTAFIPFPVGKGGTYSPIWLAPTTTAISVFKAEAFDSNTGTVSANINTLSSTRRWEAKLDSGTFTTMKVKLGDASIVATSIPVEAPAAAGVYNSEYGSTATFAAATGNEPNVITSITANAAYTGFLSYALANNCSGTPVIGATTPSTSSICLGGSVSLGIASAPTGLGVTYQWLKSKDGVVFDTILGATSVTYTAFPDTTTYYKLAAYCTASSLSDTSAPAIVSLLLPTYATVPYSQSFDNWISVCGNTEVPGTEWKNNPITGNNSWRRQDQGATANWSYLPGGTVTGFTGVGAANFHSYGTTSGLIGQLDLYANMLNPDPLEVQFDYLNLSGTDSLKVFFSDDNGTTFNQLAAFGISTTWTKQVVSLGVVLRPECIVRFQAKSDYEDDDIGIDNLQIVNVCAGAPTAGTITASANPICANTSASLSLTGATLAGGLTYQWLTSTDGVAFTFDAADSNATLNKILPDSTYFRAVLSCSGVNDTTPIYKVSMSSPTQCYCASTSTSTSDTKIDSVFFSTVAVGTSPTLCESYTDNRAFVGSATPTVPFSVRVRNGGCGSSHYVAHLSVYIDFNQNGLFTDPGEDVYQSPATTAFNTLAPFNVTVPLSAAQGQTTMRFVLRENATPFPPACGTYGWGETEDYSLNILPAPACANPPVAGNVYGPSSVCNGLTTTLVDTGFSIGTALQWEVSTDGATWANYFGAGFATSTITTAPLVDSAFYRLKVICVDSSYSNVFKISASPATQCYCTSGSDDNSDTRIDSVFFSTVVAGSPSATCESYTDNSALVGDVERLVPFTLRVRNGSCGTTYYGGSLGVYIDYNQDGDFLDAGEVVVANLGTTDFNTLPLITITPPASAALGQTRMRLVFDEFESPTSCGIYYYGETEDYTINILPAPPCTNPANAGTISGPATAQTYSIGQYIVTGAVGTKVWQYAFNPAGPFSQLIFTSDTINVGLNFIDTVYIRIIASSPGCVNDTTLVPFQTVASLQGNDVCDAVPISFGTNGKYRLGAATTQVGEPAPPSGANGWGNSNISNTLWFTFTAPASGRVSVQSPDFDTQLALWDADNCDTILKGGATLIAANDDDPNYSANGGVQYSSYLKASCLTPGKTYYVQLDSWSTPVGSKDSTSIILTDFGIINTSFTLDTAYCAGSPVVNLNPANTSGVFTGTGVSGFTFSPTTAGVGGPYTITYKIGACDSTSKTTSVIAAPTATSSITNVSCNGGNNGAIDVTISGTGPFSSSWSNGAATEDLTSLLSGTYSDTIKNSYGCKVVLSGLSVTQPAAIVVVDAVTNVLCKGSSTGAVALTVSGGVAPYKYTWSNTDTTATTSNLAAGTYYVSVYDANLCFVLDTFTVTEPTTVLSATVDSTSNPLCNGTNTGAVFASATGGVAPYTFVWSGGASTNLSAGTYTATVTDANTCSVTVTATLTEPTALVATVDSATSPKCNGDATGRVLISVSGGTAAYSYSWSNGATSQNLSNVVAGTYTCTVTDINGCSTSVSSTLSAVSALTVSTTKTNEFQGGAKGTATATAAGGTAPYSYSWSNGATTAALTNLVAATYNVTVTDANGCTATSSAVVSFVSGVGNVELVNAYEVYPNPTSGKFQIAVELAQTSDLKIEIVSSNGQLVKVINEKNVSTKVFDVDQEIAAGLYFVKLNFGDTQVTKRINVIK